MTWVAAQEYIVARCFSCAPQRRCAWKISSSGFGSLPIFRTEHQDVDRQMQSKAYILAGPFEIHDFFTQIPDR